MNVAIVICVERGYLEWQSLLLVESLRLFGGASANLPLIAYSPRPDHQPSDQTVTALRDFGVTLVDQPIAAPLGRYAMANKAYACAHAEEAGDYDYLIHLDTDVLVFNDPLVPPNQRGAVAARPADLLGPGRGTLETINEIWRKLGRSLETAGTVLSTVDQQPMPAYYNAGYVAYPTSLRLGQRWLTKLSELLDQLDPLPRWTDQAALALVLDAMPVVDPGIGYNYPLPHHERLAPDDSAPSMGQIAVLHYHERLSRGDGVPEAWRSTDWATVRWLHSRVPFSTFARWSP